MNRIRLCMVCLFVLPAVAFAQDSHYWTHQYGTRSALMGGAVVGGVRDTSAGFYNPGALGFVKDSSLSVSANAYQYSSTTINDGVGAGRDLEDTGISIVPLLISGVHVFEGLPDHVFGYSVLTRQSHSLKASERRDAILDVLSNPFAPGTEDYIGQYSVDADLNEYWGGLSWAYRLSDNISVGLTNFLAVRNQEVSKTILARAVNPAAVAAGSPFSSAAVDVFQNIDFWNIRALWKAGIAYDYDRVRFGIAATSPSVSIVGDGTVGRDLTVVNIDIDGDGIPDNLVADDRQDSLGSEFRSPASLAAGIEYSVSDSTVIGASAEWFGGVGNYAVMRPESRDFVRPTGIGLFDSQDFLLVSNSMDSVINWAVGIEHMINDKWSGYLSFRTDFEAQKENSSVNGPQLGITSWDLYHITVGASRKGENSDISFGVVYSTGQQGGVEQPVNFDNPTEAGALVGEAGSTDADYNAISIILGYTYHMG